MVKDGDYRIEFEVTETKEDGVTEVQKYSFVVTVTGTSLEEEETNSDEDDFENEQS